MTVAVIVGSKSIKYLAGSLRFRSRVSIVAGGLHHRLQRHDLGEVARQLHLAVHEGGGRLQLTVEYFQKGFFLQNNIDIWLGAWVTLPDGSFAVL